jgi:hypothetical protein
MKKAMHAKHADGDSLNEPSGTRSASRSPCTMHWGQRTRLGIKRVTPGPANHAESSACFACIVFFICAKILSCFAAPQGLHRGSRTDAIAATPSPCPERLNRSDHRAGVPDHLIGATRLVLAAARLTHCTEHDQPPVLDIVLDLFSYIYYASRLNFHPQETAGKDWNRK